jgi:hypothetical protein
MDLDAFRTRALAGIARYMYFGASTSRSSLRLSKDKQQRYRYNGPLEPSLPQDSFRRGCHTEFRPLLAKCQESLAEVVEVADINNLRVLHV